MVRATPGYAGAMARLSAKDRKKLPDSAFAGPDRSYPVPDKSHAQNAKSRAERELHDDKLSPAEAKKIERKADQVIDREDG